MSYPPTDSERCTLEEKSEQRPSAEEHTIARIEVGQVILSFYVVGSDEPRTKETVSQCLLRLKEALKNVRDCPQPERGVCAEPTVEWLEWHLRSPHAVLGWCGVFHLILSAEELAQGRGCVWNLEEYKRFSRWWFNQVLEAFRITPGGTPSIVLDEKPFLWTLALDLEPTVEWTLENLCRYRKSLTALVRARSEDVTWYTDSAMEKIIRSNLAFTTKELQLLHYNTGLIYVEKQRFQERDGFEYLRRALVDVNAMVRALRAFIMLFRSELDRRLQTWLRERLHASRTGKLLEELMQHAQSALEILRHFDELSIHMTRQIGHEQSVFQALVERYQLGQLVQALHQQVSELHYQIGDLHSQIQSRQLRWLNFLVIFPALYQAWKLVQEIWPLLGRWLGLSSS